MTLRVGSVPYFVARPLTSGLERERGIELSLDVPARLVERLRAGELDVALVSSIELFRASGYRYLEGAVIGGDGFVASVQVFLRRPLERARAIVMDPSSRTAQALVRVTLAKRAPEIGFVEVAAGRDPRAVADADDLGGWLRIGDAALRETHSDAAPATFNPSAAWKADTGLPFVFAAWIVRPGVELTRAHIDAFTGARVRGLGELDAIALRASEELGVPLEVCRRYLREQCRFELGAQLAPALRAFRDAAAALGLCRGDLEPGAIRTGDVHVQADR